MASVKMYNHLKFKIAFLNNSIVSDRNFWFSTHRIYLFYKNMMKPQESRTNNVRLIKNYKHNKVRFENYY